MARTVKARRKYGANSLDLTIPAKSCRELDIREGDVFELVEDMKGEQAILTYKKVYKYRKAST